MSATTSQKPRMLHTMLRVFDLEKSLNFYTNQLGMSLLRRNDYPEGRFTLAFVGYSPEDESAVIELTHNWDQVEPYVIGSAYGHIALGVNGIYELCAALETMGVDVVRKPGPMKHGTTVIAFLADPDGYKIELIDHGV